MSEANIETFNTIVYRDKIRSELWSLTSGIERALSSALLEGEEPDTKKALESLTQFTDAVKAHMAHWSIGEPMNKSASDDALTLPERIVKYDEDQQLVFGWFNMSVTADGDVIVDLQDDIIEPVELEKAAYEYVLESREGGEMHDGAAPQATLIESMVFTPEKLDAMGLPAEVVKSFPIAWWGGFHIHEADLFQKVKSGERSMFSIEGTARRVPVEVS